MQLVVTGGNVTPPGSHYARLLSQWTGKYYNLGRSRMSFIKPLSFLSGYCLCYIIQYVSSMDTSKMDTTSVGQKLFLPLVSMMPLDSLFS